MEFEHKELILFPFRLVTKGEKDGVWAAYAVILVYHSTFTLFNTIPAETCWALAFPISRFLEIYKKS
jgi:hypothetical protein